MANETPELVRAPVPSLLEGKALRIGHAERRRPSFILADFRVKEIFSHSTGHGPFRPSPRFPSSGPPQKPAGLTTWFQKEKSYVRQNPH